MAALSFQDSVLERMLGNYGDYPSHYDPQVDGGVPKDWPIQAMQFSHSFWEVHYWRIDDHRQGGLVNTFKYLWNVRDGGEGESEIDWLVSQYQNSSDQANWVRNITSIFGMIEIDMLVGKESYRSPGDLGYANKQHLKDWVDALP